MNENQYRKTPRANFIDYDGGDFFVTICTKDKAHYFGEIYEGEMHLSKIGEIVFAELSNPHLHHPHIDIPLFVVMPNHIHAIISISRDMACHVAKYNTVAQRSTNSCLRANIDMARHVPTLSAYISSMKSAVSRKAHLINPDFSWQSRYHDHLIRNNRDGNNIAYYIETNVVRWDVDCFNN